MTTKEQRKIWNARYYQKRKAEKENLGSEIQTKQGSIDELKAEFEKGFPEHRAYAEVFDTRPRQRDPFNPKPMIKGNADNPEAYGEHGVLVCNFCGSPLDKRGHCANCDPETY
jgi:hypothetical protein